jgi:hypothetical protein
MTAGLAEGCWQNTCWSQHLHVFQNCCWPGSNSTWPPSPESLRRLGTCLDRQRWSQMPFHAPPPPPTQVANEATAAAAAPGHTSPSGLPDTDISLAQALYGTPLVLPNSYLSINNKQTMNEFIIQIDKILKNHPMLSTTLLQTGSCRRTYPRS